MAINANKPINPFFLGNTIPDKYFCDREEETKAIISLLENGNNIVLSAPRRIGKSSLLHHILGRKEIKSRYNTLYVDIFNTKSPGDFLEAFMKAFQNGGFSNKDSKSFRTVQKEYSARIGVNIPPLSLEASMRVEKVKMEEESIEKLFDFLETTSRPNIVVFDEFQQIEEYEDKITRLLRTKIQGMNNTGFVYSGSSVHMLSSMFMQYNEPFYNSSSPIGLRRIPEQTYEKYCRRMFGLYGKAVEGEAVAFVYDLFWGNTQNLQQVMNKTFSLTGAGESASVETVKEAIGMILQERNDTYELLYHGLSTMKERALFAGVATEGLVSGITGSAFIKRYGLGSASQIQNAVRALSSPEKNILARIGEKSYVLQDKFLELWYARQAGILDMKYDSAQLLFVKHEEVITPVIVNTKTL